MCREVAIAILSRHQSKFPSFPRNSDELRPASPDVSGGHASVLRVQGFRV